MEKKREPEPGRTGTGPNRNRTEPEPTETEPNRTEPWASWLPVYPASQLLKFKKLWDETDFSAARPSTKIHMFVFDLLPLRDLFAPTSCSLNI